MSKIVGEMSKREQHLRKSFDMVKSHVHWKEPIDAKVSLDEISRYRITIEDIKEAIEYYTATVPEVETIGRTLKVKAKGYRLGPMGRRDDF
jgi:aminopeptidase-like protein